MSETGARPEGTRDRGAAAVEWDRIVERAQRSGDWTEADAWRQHQAFHPTSDNVMVRRSDVAALYRLAQAYVHDDWSLVEEYLHPDVLERLAAVLGEPS